MASFAKEHPALLRSLQSEDNLLDVLVRRGGKTPEKHVRWLLQQGACVPIDQLLKGDSPWACLWAEIVNGAPLAPDRSDLPL